MMTLILDKEVELRSRLPSNDIENLPRFTTDTGDRNVTAFKNLLEVFAGYGGHKRY
jgi:hypothetical protein